MRRATKTVATAFGILAGLAGLEHGVFELLQGAARPAGLMFPSMGPPCVPEEAWNACEPALTILPSLLVTGLLAVTLSLALLVWSIFFVERKRGGLVLIILSILLLLFGGGIFPPLIGLVGGAAATRIHRPLPEKLPGRLARTAAVLWPWPLVILIAWLINQFVVGYFFNDFLQRNMLLGLLLILTLLPLSVYSAYARDVMEIETA